jgi:hypothetical protein
MVVLVLTVGFIAAVLALSVLRLVTGLSPASGP